MATLMLNLILIEIKRTIRLARDGVFYAFWLQNQAVSWLSEIKQFNFAIEIKPFTSDVKKIKRSLHGI